MFLVNLFVLIIYQPFFNILLFFYWLMSLVTHGHPDMGVAVIFLTVVIRILMLPLSLSEDRSEEERRQIYKTLKELEVIHADNPVEYRARKKALFRSRRGIVAGEFFSLFIQVAITLMLWKIFTSGLEGADTHLIYSIMPKIPQPFNLIFLGRFDLSKPNIILNIIQSLCIFVLETLSIYTSAYPPEPGEVVRLQLILPLVSFFIFMFLPAGKKVFIITTLLFSIVITLYKYFKHRYEQYKFKKAEEAEAAAAALSAVASHEPIVVATK